MPLFNPATSGGIGIYGDGNDGAQTFDGSTTILGIVPSSNTYTLARDIWLSSGTINSGVTIITNGFRIFCQGALTNNGTISWNGNNGTNGGAGGAALTNGTGSVNSGTAGMAGGAGATGAGNAGTNCGRSFNGNTGATTGNGGAGGTVGANAGGAGGNSLPGGTGSPSWFPRNSVFGPMVGLGGYTPSAIWIAFNAAAGGGGGAGDGTNSGGGGGSGGGFVQIFAKTFAGTGNIQARGGNGGNGATVGNTGGGGGGGGGIVYVCSSSVVSSAIAGQTIDANGGAKGTHFGTGADGVVGNAGTLFLVPN